VESGRGGWDGALVGALACGINRALDGALGCGREGAERQGRMRDVCVCVCLTRGLMVPRRSLSAADDGVRRGRDPGDRAEGGMCVSGEGGK